MMKILFLIFTVVGVALTASSKQKKPAFLKNMPGPFPEKPNLMQDYKDYVFSESVQVDGLTMKQDTYVGYINVRESGGGKLFYMYHSPMGQPKSASAPVVIWLQGGPGCASMTGAFYEMGPLQITGYDNVTGNATFDVRSTTWTKGAHMIFIDQPIGVGLSISSDTEWTNSTDQAAQDLHTFMVRFYEVYPELKANPLYITGESYAGHYVPAFAHAIYMNQSQNGINLAGMAIGNGWVDPINQYAYYDFYAYSTGLISDVGREYISELQAQAMVLIQQGRLQEATPVMDSITDYIENVSPGLDIYNYRIYSSQQDELPTLSAWLNDPRTQKWFNIPPYVQFDFCNGGVYGNFSYDMSTSVASYVADLTGKIKIMIYSGADDIIVNTAGTNNWLVNNEYPWSDDIRRAKKTIWTKNGNVLGTVAATNTFWQVIVNKAGHMVPGDQGVSGLDMLRHFIQGDKIWQN